MFDSGDSKGCSGKGDDDRDVVSDDAVDIVGVVVVESAVTVVDLSLAVQRPSLFRG